MKNLFLTFALLLSAASAFAVAPSPYTVCVTYSFRTTGAPSSGAATMTVFGESTTDVSTTLATGSNLFESPTNAVFLRPGKTYSVRFETLGCSPSRFDLSFMAPAGYQVVFGTQPRDIYSETITGTSSASVFNYTDTLQIIPLANSSGTSAGAFSGIDLGKSVTWSVGLGGLRTGRDAGLIFFKEADLVTNPPASRDRLYYTAPANQGQVDVYKIGGVLRQVKTPQVFVDLVDDSGSSGGYTMKFYNFVETEWTMNPSTLIYDAISPSPTPWRTIHVASVVANQLTITETDGTGIGAVVRVSLLTLTGSISSGNYQWTLKEGAGTTWLRTTTHVSANFPTATPAYREDVVEVHTGDSTAAGSLVTKTKFRYETPGSWGEELVKIVIDPDTAQLTTTYTYDASVATYDTTTGISNAGNYGKIKSVTGPTGNWTSYSYYDDWNRRGQLALETHPYVNTPGTLQAADITVGSSVAYDYDFDHSGRQRIEKSRQRKTNNSTALTGKSITAPSVNLTARNSMYYTTYQTDDYFGIGGSDYQRSISEVVDPRTSNPDLFNLPLSIKRPDQSQDSYAYFPVDHTYAVSTSGTYFRTNIWHGSTSSSGADAFTSYGTSPEIRTVTAIYLVPNKSTMDVIIRNPAGLVVRTETWVYTGGGSNFSPMTSEDFTYDFAGRLTQRAANNGATVDHHYTDGRQDYTVDATGCRTEFIYDEIGRIKTSIKKGVAASGTFAAQSDIYTHFVYDGANNVKESVVTNAATKPTLPGGALDLFTTSMYDLAGRLTQRIENAGSSTNSLATGYAYTSGGKIVTATLPGGATKITETYLDGQLKSITGTAVVGEYLAYARDDTSGNRRTEHRFASTSSPAITTTTTDWLGRKISFVQPGWNGSTTTQSWRYNSYGQLDKFSQPGVADNLFTYDTLGGLYREGLDIDGTNGTLDPASNDRITDHAWTFYTSDGHWWRRDTTSTYATATNGTATQIGKIETQLSGLPASRLSFANSSDIFGNVTASYVDLDRPNKKVTATTDTADSNIHAVQISCNGLQISAQDTAGIIRTYEYDALGRQTKSIDPRTKGPGPVWLGTVATYKSGTSLVDAVTDPAGIVQAAYSYDSTGRVATVTNALGKVARYEYTDLGQKFHEWGDTINPAEYGYDAYGRQNLLKTFANATATFAGTSATAWPTTDLGTPALTLWVYDQATGLLKEKYDAANLDSSGQPIAGAKKVSYTYTQAGQVFTRTGQRGIVSTYGYSPTTGELTGVTYTNDPANTAPLAFGYNRLGQQSTVDDSTGTRTFTSNLAGTLELQREDLPAYFGSRRLTAKYATAGIIGRPTGFQLGSSGTPAADQDVGYVYQTDGRFSALTAGGQTFTYGYTPDSHLIGTVTNSAAGYIDSRTYDPLRDLIASRTATIGAATKASFAYTQDDLGRVTDVTKTGELFGRYGNGTDGLKTTFGYDPRSQLTAEQTTIGTTTELLAGRNNGTATLPGFAYDQLGNRTATKHNPTSGADTTHTATYTPNALNQYAQRTVPGFFDVAGAMVPGAAVTVNASTADVVQQGGYFFKEQSMSNSTTAAFATLVVSDGVTHVADASLGTVPTAWRIAGAADFNSDGQKDIVWQNTTTGERYLWFMNGTSQSGAALLGTLDITWSIAGTADFNGDGHPDILWQNTSTGERYVWFMTGASQSGAASLGFVSTAWSIAGAADFNGDGQTDIVWQNTTTGERYLWFMTGTSQSGAASLGYVGIAWSIAGTADFNGDGQTDILWQDTTTGERYLWLMTGASLSGAVDLGTISPAQSIATAADMNADGHPDILWQDTATGARYVWLMTGSTAQVPAYVAKTAEVFGYDDDGNLTADGRWTYGYDAENRLITMETIPAAVSAGLTRQKLTFAYDYLGRRISKIVQSGWNGSSYANTDLSRRFIYHGWNLIAELNHLAGEALASSHFWGLDLSGSTQGAGGVGGLLLTQEGGQSYLPMYDGNGNLHGMIKASDGTIAAAYEYDAFGNTLRESGPYAASNPFRFSTKYTDIETGLVYYGLRYYSPALGRFINRDPIEEAGGVNLYGFCGNNGVNRWDYLGMTEDGFGGRPEVELDGDGGRSNIYFDTSGGRSAPTVNNPTGDQRAAMDAMSRMQAAIATLAQTIEVRSGFTTSNSEATRAAAQAVGIYAASPSDSMLFLVVSNTPGVGAPSGGARFQFASYTYTTSNSRQRLVSASAGFMPYLLAGNNPNDFNQAKAALHDFIDSTESFFSPFNWIGGAPSNPFTEKIEAFNQYVADPLFGTTPSGGDFYDRAFAQLAYAASNNGMYVGVTSIQTQSYHEPTFYIFGGGWKDDAPIRMVITPGAELGVYLTPGQASSGAAAALLVQLQKMGYAKPPSPPFST